VTWIQAIILGIVEGITEFLPVSSTGHLTITEQLMGLPIDDDGVTAFTAVIQLGAIAAALWYFRADLIRLALAWFRGLRSRAGRADPDYRFAWYVILGSLPIAVVGLLAKDLITGPLRSLWVVVAALVGWSVVMIGAERLGRRNRSESAVTLSDAMVIGTMQVFALIPGVSRSGATISAGLLRDLDRVAATRISFLLGIPALTAAGVYEAATEAGAISTAVGWGPTLVATLTSLVVAYVAIAWLLRLVARRPISVFVPYRIGLAAVIAVLLTTGTLTAV
jgi:undecaprenyl-diphosphatase